MKNAYLYIVVSLALILPVSVYAADVSISADPSIVGVGKEVAVTLHVDTAHALNSFAGVLTFDPAILTPVSVSDGNSISSIWLEHPKPGATSTPFTGFAPGGFVGKGQLFTIVFKARAQGTTNVTLLNAQFLQNDGQGTTEEITVHPLALSILSSQKGGYAEAKDTVPPEFFTLFFGRNTSVYDGAPYLAFAPVDKGSGVDRVEVGETRLPFLKPSFTTSDSPYKIRDTYGTSRVVVRAYDRAGNVREEVFPRQHLFRPYELIVLGTLGAVLLLWLFFTRRRG